MFLRVFTYLLSGVYHTPWVHSCRLGYVLRGCVGRHRIFITFAGGIRKPLCAGVVESRKRELRKLPLAGIGQPCVALDLVRFNSVVRILINTLWWYNTFISYVNSKHK